MPCPRPPGSPIHRRRSHLPAKLAVRTWLGSTAIISTGGSAGPEGPIVTIGATLGSVIARFLRADPQTATTLVGCGAAAGLAAVFNAPMTGIFFVLEVLLRDFSLKTFTPIVIAVAALGPRPSTTANPHRVRPGSIPRTNICTTVAPARSERHDPQRGNDRPAPLECRRCRPTP